MCLQQQLCKATSLAKHAILQLVLMDLKIWNSDNVHNALNLLRVFHSMREHEKHLGKTLQVSTVKPLASPV